MTSTGTCQAAWISIFDWPGGSSSPGLMTKPQCMACLTGFLQKYRPILLRSVSALP